MYPFLLAFIIIISCDKSSNNNANYTYMKQGFILGYDMAMCACCGGVVLTDNPASSSSRILIDTSLVKLNLSATDVFPVKINYDWQKDSSKGCNNFIKITKMQRL
jgi:hypothetical protein